MDKRQRVTRDCEGTSLRFKPGALQSTENLEIEHYSWSFGHRTSIIKYFGSGNRRGRSQIGREVLVSWIMEAKDLYFPWSKFIEGSTSCGNHAGKLDT